MNELKLNTYLLARETKNFLVYQTEQIQGERPQTQYVPKEAFEGTPPKSIEVFVRW